MSIFGEENKISMLDFIKVLIETEQNVARGNGMGNPGKMGKTQLQLKI